MPVAAEPGPPWGGGGHSFSHLDPPGSRTKLPFTQWLFLHLFHWSWFPRAGYVVSCFLVSLLPHFTNNNNDWVFFSKCLSLSELPPPHRAKLPFCDPAAKNVGNVAGTYLTFKYIEYVRHTSPNSHKERRIIGNDVHKYVYMRGRGQGDEGTRGIITN